MYSIQDMAFIAVWGVFFGYMMLYIEKKFF